VTHSLRALLALNTYFVTSNTTRLPLVASFLYHGEVFRALAHGLAAVVGAASSRGAHIGLLDAESLGALTSEFEAGLGFGLAALGGIAGFAAQSALILGLAGDLTSGASAREFAGASSVGAALLQVARNARHIAIDGAKKEIRSAASG